MFFVRQHVNESNVICRYVDEDIPSRSVVDWTQIRISIIVFVLWYLGISWIISHGLYLLFVFILSF